jgi:large subunit ribosomal protein L24
MLNVKKGDVITVLSGKYKGKNGKVLKVLHKQERIIVQHINVVTKHIKPNKGKGILNGKLHTVEAPIHISKVMIICPKCHGPFRIRYNISAENTKNKIRICRTCGVKI